MKLLVVGDIYLGRGLEKFSDLCPEDTFGGLREWMAESDLVVCNLEGPITRQEAPLPKTGPALRMRPGAARFLRQAGFDLAALANNHIFDFGAPGLSETFADLRDSGLDWVGGGSSLSEARKPYVFSSDGQSVGILNFAENEWSTTHSEQPGANPVDLVQNFRDIRALKEKTDYVVVICHGGHEMCRLPSPGMRERLRFYVEAGADAVLNHHQHVVSGFERYQGAPIFYGLGNCLFDWGSKPPPGWCEGAAVTLEIAERGLDFEIHHFDQCGNEKAIVACSAQESRSRDEKLAELSQIIVDDSLLARKFREELNARSRMYRAYLFPVRNRYIQALHNRGLFPGLLSKQKKRLYLNLVRCESHREAFTWLLEREVEE